MAYDRDDDYRRRGDYERGRHQQGGGEAGGRRERDDDYRRYGGRQQQGERFGGGFSRGDDQLGDRDDDYGHGRGGTFGMGSDRSAHYGGAQGGYSGAGDRPRLGYGRDDRSGADYGYGPENRGSDYAASGVGPGGFGASYSAYGSGYGSRDRGGWSGERSYGGGDRGYSQGGRDFWDKAGDEVASWFGDEEAERRRRRDEHRGRGPKNYMRSDDRIKEDVNDRLTDDGWIDASDIEVEVSNREVTLSGQVDSRMAKRHAEDIAESVSGVSHVQNNLRVRDNRSGASSGMSSAGTISGRRGSGA